MSKLLLYATVVICMLYSTSCSNIENFNNGTASVTEFCDDYSIVSTEPTVISSDDAVSLVRTAISTKYEVENLHFVSEGEEAFDDVVYYRVHVYSLSSKQLYGTDGNPYYQQYTFGWFYVDKITGEVYVDNMLLGNLELYE